MKAEKLGTLLMSLKYETGRRRVTPVGVEEDVDEVELTTSS
jgi:hypothetical protein